MYPLMGLAMLACLASLARAFQDPTKFLIVSNAANGGIYYLRLPHNQDFSDTKVHTLVEPGTELKNPQGIAVDFPQKRLIVTDPTLKQVLSVRLYIDGDDLDADHKWEELAHNVESRWVTTDGRGSVYFTDEADDKLYKILANGSGEPEVLYSGGGDWVRKPSGVGTDNFNVFWTNKLDGMMGKAPATPGGNQTEKPQKFVDDLRRTHRGKTYGVCLSMDNIFTTQHRMTVQGLKKAGGETVVIANSFNNPRGCAWDGDSTVYVADAGSGGIYFFPSQSGALSLESARVAKAVDVDDAYGLAVLISWEDQPSSCRRAVSGALIGLLALRFLNF